MDTPGRREKCRERIRSIHTKNKVNRWVRVHINSDKRGNVVPGGGRPGRVSLSKSGGENKSAR